MRSLFYFIIAIIFVGCGGNHSEYKPIVNFETAGEQDQNGDMAIGDLNDDSVGIINSKILKIMSVEIDDNDGSSVYIDEGDTITIKFNIGFKNPAGQSKIEIDSLYQFNDYSIAEDYSGTWVDDKTHVIKILKVGKYQYIPENYLSLSIKDVSKFSAQNDNVNIENQVVVPTGSWGGMMPHLEKIVTNDLGTNVIYWTHSRAEFNNFSYNLYWSYYENVSTKDNLISGLNSYTYTHDIDSFGYGKKIYYRIAAMSGGVEGPLSNTLESFVLLPKLKFYSTELYDPKSTNKNIVGENVKDLYVDKENNLWCVTSLGVSKYRDGKFEVLNLENAIYTSVAGNDEGTIFIGSNKGLFLYKGDTWVIKTGKDGLSNDYILSLRTDPKDRVWIKPRGL